MAKREKLRPELTGVPETMLWPLWNRAAESRRLDGILRDPLSVDLVRRINYRFFLKFGVPTPYLAVRARFSDELIKRYIAKNPKNPVVVALGEGLETQFWRIGDDKVRWISVDLPEAIDVRRKLLPESDQQTLVACSALDPDWMDAVPEGSTPFISAAGLLMYLQEDEVRQLLTMIIGRFPDAELFFDAIPRSFSRLSRNGVYVTRNYRAPRMPWGVSIRDLPRFARSIPGWRVALSKTYGEAFPVRTPISSSISRLPATRGRISPSLNLLKGMGSAK
ncbi:MAG: class I SAM-dependent methyltransferase [Pseudomonadota bacterium]